ncbi:MAG: hypothetical protein M0Z36_10765 [Thermaerobacter sp.]|nr:hypothetical protein [Thermaerobacter sp.]
MPKKRSSWLQWVASVTVVLMGVCGYGLTGQYGFEWIPRWIFLLGLLVVFVIGGWGSWYLTHNK